MSSEIGMWRFSECAGLCVGEGVCRMILEGRRMFRSMRSWELSGLIGFGKDGIFLEEGASVG